jgi:hypothetical protein
MGDRGSSRGIWAPGGLSTDGNFTFAATGNTEDAKTWMGGEAVLRLGPGATFSGDLADYFSPSNWQDLDAADADVGNRDGRMTLRGKLGLRAK